MKTCAVIPAAGRGSRLNLTIPKILLALTTTQTIWSVLRHHLIDLVDHIHIIVSPQGEYLLRRELANDLNSGLVSMSIQPKPIGMGDAIFQGYSTWSQAEQIIIIWGDQACVSKETLKRSLQAHKGQAHTIALPLTLVIKPYVEYLFDDSLSLIQIKQSREGDHCADKGLSDVGTFVMSVPNLLPAWRIYTKQASCGSQTKEINFLPFLPFLVTNGWHIKQVQVANTHEARGINTPDDLLFFNTLMKV